MRLKSVMHKAVRKADKHLPVILTGLGVAGLVATAVLSAKAGADVKGIVEETDFHNLEKESKREVIFKEVAPAIAPAAVTGLLSAGCIIGAHMKSAAQIATITGLYAMKNNELKEWKDGAQRFLGDKKVEELQANVAENRVENELDAGDTLPTPVEETGYGTTEVLDLTTGRRFHCDIEKIRQVVNNINNQLNLGERQTISDFYYELNLQPGRLDDVCGWDLTMCHKLMDVKYASILKDGRKPILTIFYDWDVVDGKYFYD